ncbi:MAG TPA: YbaK/EbsC family protein [Terriglobia bacterium]|nr:YbaK/EbsC family protein [Terriglobia bacterium]
MSVTQQVCDYLESHHTRYQLLTHPQAFAAEQTAHELRVPDQQFAKAIVFRADGRAVMAVVPASMRVNVHALREALKAKNLEMAPENELAKLCSDCELGAFPPFGNLYGMEVWVDQSLAQSEEIVFNAGSHTQALQLKYSDFADLAHPRSAKIAELPTY